MEKGINTLNESLSDPYWSMNQDIQDVKMGLKTFEELRQAWVSRAKQTLQELESHAGIVTSSDLPDPNSADTTA